ncbi:MAG: hypothetical protein R3Y47_09275 [Lachnospiraceae bacterium]
MNKEMMFAKALEQVKKLAKEQGNVISEVQLFEAFGPLELEEEKMKLVYDYLAKQKIGIGEAVDLDEFLSEQDFDYLAVYLEEISMLKPVSDGEKKAYLLSAMAGEASAQVKLIEIYLQQVVDIARLYAGQGAFIEDLIGEGNVALAMGVSMIGCEETSEEAEGVLIKLVMDAMEDYIDTLTVQSTEDKKTANMVNDISDKAKELSELLHKKVTPEELSTELDVAIEEIEEAVRISANHIEYIEYEEK